MTHPTGEGYLRPPEIADSPAQLPGLAPLEMDQSVQITRLGMQIQDQPPAAEDVVSIIVSGYEGRNAEGKPFPYAENPNVDAVRILDVSSLPITARTSGSEAPAKANFVSMHWETVFEGERPRPVFTPLLPGVEYAAKNPTGNTAATYSISEEGALTVTRSRDMPEGTGDVRLVGQTLIQENYVRRPARGTISPEAIALETEVRLGRGDARVTRDGHLFVTPGTFEFVDTTGDLATITVRSEFLLPIAERGAFESWTAHTIAARERRRTHGTPAVADFTTIGKEEPTGGQPPVV